MQHFTSVYMGGKKKNPKHKWLWHHLRQHIAVFPFRHSGLGLSCLFRW